MAIAQGSKVGIVTATGGVILGSVNPQPPLFGVCTATAEGTVSVLFDNGIVVDTLPVAALDEILDPNDETFAFVGKTVSITDQCSTYTGIVVSAYARGTTQCVLIKTLANGAFLETTSGNVTAILGA